MSENGNCREVEMGRHETRPTALVVGWQADDGTGTAVVDVGADSDCCCVQGEAAGGDEELHV